MKILTGLSTLALLAGLMLVTNAPSTAGPPPGHITAKCSAGFMAAPGWYTSAQLNSQLGVKYACSRNLPPNSRSPFGKLALTCSDGLSPMGDNAGADAPHIDPGGKATYYCISAGPH